ncbi:MAG TPA: zf-HC2 domain-containing protein, partial [Tepidisphaeraceae bacterium]
MAMESSKEKIESQLCAYVEGELDDAERAEIERHLQTNPQHKTLIAELRQQRHLLQTLPKANIPGELNESLTGQLERSALLNEDDQTSEAGMRINRWPQLAAVAAVLFLAVGLGVVVYYVLPGHGGGHNGTVGGAIAMNDGTAAAKRAPALPASGPATAEAELETLKRDRDAKLEEKSAQDLKVIAGRPEAAATATAPVADARARGFGYESLADRAAAPLRELTTGPGLVTPGEVVQLQQWMNRTIGGAANDAFHLAPQNSLYLVVQTSDPATANGQVVAYFKSNNIQYMSQPERLAADKDLNYAFRSNDAAPKPGSQAGEGGGRGAGGGSGGAFGGGIANGTTAAAPSSLAGGASALAPAQTPNAAKPIDQARGVASPPASDAETLSLGASDKAAKSDPAKAAVEVGQASELSKGVAGAAAGNQPADRFKEQDSAGEGRVALRARGETALRRATLPQAAGELAAEAPRPAAGDVIVARMNRRQANELSAALSREQGQRAELREFGDIDATIATGVKATLADNSAASAKLGTVVAQDRGREA